MSAAPVDGIRDDQGDAVARVTGSPVPHLFVLDRQSDPTGVSGLGIVAVGVAWPHDAGAVYRWCSSTPPPGYDRPVQQIGVFETLADVLGVHGHQGATVLRTATRPVLFTPLGGAALARLFAVTSSTNDIAAWGVEFDGGQAVTHRPSRSPLKYDTARRPSRVEVWRDLGDVRRELVTAQTRSGGIVWLDSHPGSRLLNRAAARHGGT